MSNSDTHDLRIPCVVRTTPNKGKGLFADAFIPAGTTVWRHIAGQYAVYDELSLAALLFGMTDCEATYVLTHIYGMAEFPGYMIRVFDEGELINHSDHPTLITHTDPGYGKVSTARCLEDVSTALLGNYFTLVAACDIEKDQELSLDYNDDPQGPSYYDKLCEQYGVTWDWLSNADLEA